MPNCQTCERGRRATGELGYHGQEGYRTRHYDAYRAEDLPNKSPDHPDYDENYQEGYETQSTGFIQVGARDYDPAIGRWLEVDPQPAGPEMQLGQLNRWAYCANDPVNISDPTGEFTLVLGIIGLVCLLAAAICATYAWDLNHQALTCTDPTTSTDLLLLANDFAYWGSILGIAGGILFSIGMVAIGTALGTLITALKSAMEEVGIILGWGMMYGGNWSNGTPIGP